MTRAALRRDLAIALALLLALLAWDASGLDLAAARAFGDARGFAWRDHWLASRVLHDGGRWLGLGVLALLAVHLLRPLWPGMPARERAWWLMATLACALLVPALKSVSRTSCPWDLAEFGGVAQYVSHWRFGVGDGGAGRCFPSGHASSAFALLSGWFVLRHPHPRLARAWLVAVLLLGAAFGLAQLARGARYPSHTLWTGWLCWTLCALSAPMLGRSAVRPALA
jgi:membrane-associated PAP2 superfamily phosphatase